MSDGSYLTIQLAKMLARLIEDGEHDCLALPGHEASCDCANHERVRDTVAEARSLLRLMEVDA